MPVHGEFYCSTNQRLFKLLLLIPVFLMTDITFLSLLGNDSKMSGLVCGKTQRNQKDDVSCAGLLYKRSAFLIEVAI